MVSHHSIASIDGDGDAPDLTEACARADGAALVLDEILCIRCGLCVDRCPTVW